MRFILLRGRPLILEELVLRFEGVAKKALWIDALGGVVRAGVDAARCGKLRAQVARVRFVSGDFFLVDLHRGRRAFGAFHFRLGFPNDLERMHVDIAVGTKLGAFAAADAPIFDDDLEIFFAADGADRALRHA